MKSRMVSGLPLTKTVPPLRIQRTEVWLFRDPMLSISRTLTHRFSGESVVVPGSTQSNIKNAIISSVYWRGPGRVNGPNRVLAARTTEVIPPPLQGAGNVQVPVARVQS